MEEKKRKKILKISLWVGAAVIAVLIVVLAIVAADYRKRAEELQKQNEQIEEVLNEETDELESIVLIDV